jgi:hypothetical protein
MRTQLVVPFALALLFAPNAALAGRWYYKWICTGQCASGPYQGFDGREGPWATYEECDYVRSRDRRDRGPRPYTIMFCEDEDGPGSSRGRPAYVPAAAATQQKVHLSVIETGLAAGQGWSAKSDTGTTTGAFTVGIELDGHAGRDFGGGSMQLGFYGTKLEAPLLGSEPRSWFLIPLAIGLVITPQVYESGETSVRLDLGASAGGFYGFGCSDCAGPVFQEGIGFGYTLKAGLDLYLSRTGGVSLDVILPRYTLGAAVPGNLELSSPKWMVRLSLLEKPSE